MRYKYHRDFLKSNFNDFKSIKTDKIKGIPQPLINKDYDNSHIIIPLPSVDKNILSKENIFECIESRRSTRFFSEEGISLEELSYLLWATQGNVGKNNIGLTLKTVPCSGATHSFETYLFIMNVNEIDAGIYRYIPEGHKLLFMFTLDKIENTVDDITLEQQFVANFAKKSHVLFAWSTTPYRSEWKFDITAHKKILIDIGHVCQNLYLASESINSGTCAIGIYDQKKIDNILNLDGEEEFIIYLAAVGKKIK